MNLKGENGMLDELYYITKEWNEHDFRCFLRSYSSYVVESISRSLSFVEWYHEVLGY